MNKAISKKIIHIFHDDKFIDGAIKLFEEVAPKISEYYVVKKKGIALQYVKSDQIIRIDLDDNNERETFLESVNSEVNSVIFVHALDYTQQKVVLRINKAIPKVWFIWGYDLYLTWPLLHKTLYLIKTKKLLGVKSNYKTNLLSSSVGFFLFKNHLLLKTFSKKTHVLLGEIFDTDFYKAARMIDYVAPIVPTEMEIIKGMKLPAKYVPFEYVCLQDLLGDKINETVYGKPNIMVGNSADPSNNHVDVFEKLAKMDLKGRKIYVPLSYGGNDFYKKAVIEEGRRLFKDNFHPLTDFMPLEKYNEVLLSCGTLILNHVRQQAVGNIVVMGYLGAKIYLNNASPVYKYYKQQGIVISSTNELADNNFQQNLSSSNIALNKSRFYDLYSREAVHTKITVLVNKVLQQSF